MTNPADSSVQNLLPVQAYFDAQNNFVTFIGQGQPFTAIIDPDQSGLHITNSTIDSSVIGGTTPAVGYFTSGYVSVAPTTATGIANKQYVDYYAAGLSWKQPVKAASLANIATLSGFQTVDSVPLTDGDRVLVKNQSQSKYNGIYVVRSGAWEYAVGADDWQEYVGAIVFVEEGSQAYSAWYSLAQEGGTLGVTALDWANFSVSSTYSAGTGLSLNAGVFSITNTGVTNGTYGSASKTVTLAINAQGQATSASQQDIAIAATQITSGTINSARLSGSYSGITGLGTLGNLTVTNPISGSVTGSSASTTNLLGGAAGSLPYQTATNATGFLAASTDGYILSLVSGVPAWIPNTVGTVTAVTASAPLASSGGSTPNITITQAGSASNGYLSSTDWNTFNGKAGAGANSDITSMTGLTGGISTPTFIQWGNGTGQSTVAGKQYYDPATGSHNLVMGNGNITQQVGEELYYYGKASSAITDSPLQLVYKTGTVGASGVITFAPTVSGITDGDLILGVATENLALNAFGRITTFGVVHGITTDGSAYGETWADGDVIWYNPVNGNPTKTKPVAPNIKVSIGTILKAGSGGSGSIQVEVNHGSVLGGTDSNVQITSASNGNILTYDGGNGYWKNTALTAGTGISVSTSANGVLTVASTVTGGLTITDDTTTNATRYLTFTSATSGSITGENVASTKLQFNPSTGTLTATALSGALAGSNVSGNISGNATNVTGTVAVANGGTGLTSTPSNGQIDIGNGTGFTRATLTAGAGISITNGSGSITIANTAPNIVASYLIVAGGGGGGGGGVGAYEGSGAGAGGLLSGTQTLVSGTTYSFTIGAGGGGGAANTAGSNGSNSTAFGLTAIGGGFGAVTTGTGGSGGSGGSGGLQGGGGAPGSGTSGQGTNGINPSGGGAGASPSGGNGGAGLASSITGSSVFYAGGGAGADLTGGTGGGGNGGTSSVNAQSGTANTGGGGGGGKATSGKQQAGNGGSGVVIISIPTSLYTGTTTGSPTVTTSGSNTIIKFTASGSYTA